MSISQETLSFLNLFVSLNLILVLQQTTAARLDPPHLKYKSGESSDETNLTRNQPLFGSSSTASSTGRQNDEKFY